MVIIKVATGLASQYNVQEIRHASLLHLLYMQIPSSRGSLLKC